MRFVKNMALRWSSGWPASDSQNAIFMRLGERMAPGPVADPAARAFFKEYLAE